MSAATHPVAPEEVMALLDGELSAAAAQLVSTHIEHCAECTALAGQLRDTSKELLKWTVDSVPSQLVSNILTEAPMEAANSEDGHSNVFRHPKRWTLKKQVFVFGLGATAAVLLLFFSIATPNLMRSRMAANEASAVGSLRTLNTALASYSSTYGHYPFSLGNLGPGINGRSSEDSAGLVEPMLATGRKSGFLFMYRAELPNRGYTINASPIDSGSSGYRTFSTDQTGAIRTDGGKILDESSPDSSEERSKALPATKEVASLTSKTEPMIARKADLKLVVGRLDEARHGMDRIPKQYDGYVGNLALNTESGSAPSLAASLRIPTDQLDHCLEDLRKLGRLTSESLEGEELSQQHIDLVARLKNSQNTEARLNGILQQRTGQTKDILEVERESARVRGEIEQMEAEQKTLEHRVEFATVNLNLTEEYKAQLLVPEMSVWTRLHNALVAGYRNASESLLGIVLWFAEFGPALLIWLVLLGLPVSFVWRRYRRNLATI